MATLSSEQRKNIASQLSKIKEQLEKIKAARASQSSGSDSLPAGLNDAQIGGASGVGFETEENQEAIAEQVEAVTESGGSKSQAGDRTSASQAASLTKRFGLEGLVDASQFQGLTFGEAASKARAAQQARTSQVSASTTFAFNPETLRRTQRAIDKLGFSLDEAGNDPFEPNEFKEENKKTAVELTQKEIGNLFTDQNDLLNAYNTNQNFKSTIDKLIAAGGSVEGIGKNITGGVTVDNQITNAQVDAGLLPEDQRENVPQDSFNMLAGISNPQANKEAEERAMEELIPETQIAQDEIARNARIPEDLQTLYFGDEKTLGILDIRKNQAAEEIKLLEEQEKDAKRTARERASLQVDKNRAEVKKQRAAIEENRLRAKNYMTGALAKLGALKTTGAAPLALQTLETKYQGQVTQLETAYEFANREIEIGLDESLDGIENKTDSDILGIQQDLTKDTETVTKEILKAQQAAEKEIYRITEQYARRLRTRTTKYTEDIKKAAESYAKSFAKTASDANAASVAARLQPGEQIDEGVYVPNRGVVLPNGEFAQVDLAPAMEREVANANLRGVSTIRYFSSLESSFRDLIQRTAQETGENFSFNKLKGLYKDWVAEQESDDDDDEDVY